MTSTQDLVDALAADIGRPVGIDDRRFRALAYSSHDDGVDKVRRDSILHREAPQAVTQWLLSLGIGDASSHVRVPANPDLGMDARLCVPLHFEGTLHGYLWLIDDPPLEDSEVLALTERYAELLAAELARVSHLEGADRESRKRALSRLLFEADPGDAADELRAALNGGHFVALTAKVHPPAATLDSPVRVHLSLAAEEVRRGISSNRALAIELESEVVVVVAFEDPGEPTRRAVALLAACRGHLVSAADGDVQVTVGVGAPRTDLLGLGESHREARLAAEIGYFVPDLARERPVRWEDLGAYRTLATLLDGRDPGSLLPRSLLDLLAERDGSTLVETVETYLDLGGDAKAASEQLFLHRSSLYKRLHRVERLTGYDLRRGDDRLEHTSAFGSGAWAMGVRGDDRRLRPPERETTFAAHGTGPILSWIPCPWERWTPSSSSSNTSTSSCSSIPQPASAACSRSTRWPWGQRWEVPG